uniref:Uncharacterized protein n=1 Tax=Anguilla anguilla TaxID=7936 RepID=A0A0E9RK63_ANGAN
MCFRKYTTIQMAIICTIEFVSLIFNSSVFLSQPYSPFIT